MSCLHTYAQRYTPLLSAMQEDLQEFHAAGTISRARHLAQVTGQHFNADQLPQYFTGDPDGPVVLVHLNPKQATAPDQIPGWLTTARTLEDYFDACRHFGARMYGPSSPRTHQSPFDHKQIRFLHPLGVVDFVQEHRRADRFTNLERVVDDKLQLSWCLTTLSRSRLAASLLRSSRPTSAASCQRSHRTAPICPVLRYGVQAAVVRARHALARVSPAQEGRHAGAAALLLRQFAAALRGRPRRAGLAQSWARQGIPMTSYAKEIRSRYGDAGR